jgi:hypothetical protein
MSRVRNPTLDQCFECREHALSLAFVFSAEGSLERGHYSDKLLSVCGRCGGGAIEIYSLDRFERPHDMYWWVTLDPAQTQALRQWLASCPAPLSGSCVCAVHAARLVSDGFAAGLRSDRGCEVAGRAVFEREQLALVQGARVPLRPQPPRVERRLDQRVPPQQTRFYIAGLRPLKRVVTGSGELVVLKMSWETCAFEDGLEYLHRIMYGDEVDEVTEDEFIQHVEALRGERLQRDGALGALYSVIEATESAECELVAELRRRTYALFQELHPDPYYD